MPDKSEWILKSADSPWWSASRNFPNRKLFRKTRLSTAVAGDNIDSGGAAAELV